jgi:selenocysteine lyase/cysteine desulfurase
MPFFDVNLVRQQFPSLGRSAVFLDNPAGTQIAQQSLDRINRYLLECNANHEGMFETSRKSDVILHEAHAVMADFLNASRPEEIIFGNNMTTLTLHISRSRARNLQAGDNILVTRLDHDANISSWMLVAEDRGCNLIWVDIDVVAGTLDLKDFEKALEHKPKIAAFGYASNLLGTINPVNQLSRMAKDAGARVYIDAMQYAPHGPIDVQEIDCDFLVCSSYKYSKSQITRNIQFHGSPGHRKDKTVIFWSQIPKRVMGYNECLSPFSFSELLQ